MCLLCLYGFVVELNVFYVRSDEWVTGVIACSFCQMPFDFISLLLVILFTEANNREVTHTIVSWWVLHLVIWKCLEAIFQITYWDYFYIFEGDWKTYTQVMSELENIIYQIISSFTFKIGYSSRVHVVWRAYYFQIYFVGTHDLLTIIIICSVLGRLVHKYLPHLHLYLLEGTTIVFQVHLR